MSNLKTLYTKYHQSPWLDNLSREILESGELSDLIRSGIKGITSNPSIFEHAISKGNFYTPQIIELARNGLSPEEIYWLLAKSDVINAAKLLSEVYAETNKQDGFVSLEVSPRLARDTEATIAQARSLWNELQSPNVMIKVPATKEGLPAITTLLSEGININVTLLFSVERYTEVINAFKQGVSGFNTSSAPASVASFFVSRIDTMIDEALDEINTTDAVALKGKSAIAQARLAYKKYTEMFTGDLEPVQRILWASTSTKNPSYDDLMYVSNLVSPGSINTLPNNTLDAIQDHLPVELNQISADDIVDAGNVLDKVKNLGVNFDDCLEQLELEGVDKFNKSYDQLIKAIEDQIN